MLFLAYSFLVDGLPFLLVVLCMEQFCFAVIPSHASQSLISATALRGNYTSLSNHKLALNSCSS